MNPTQFAQQIKYRLETLTWPEDISTGTQDAIFGARGSVLVVAGDIEESAIPAGFPAALVRVENGVPDDDHPDLIAQDFSVVSMTDVSGGAMGEFALIGGARPDLGKSAGAGILEIAEQVRSRLEMLTAMDGARVQLSASQTTAARLLGRTRHIAFDELTLSAVCTSAAHYSAPQQLAHTSDTWTWVGDHCESRFDFVQYRLAYNLGSTPPTSPDAAAGVVYSGTAPTTTHQAGTGRAYAIFADYAQRGDRVSNSSLGTETGAFLTT